MPNSLNEVMAHVWPIFKVRSTESNFQPIEFCGTGFVLVGGLFITCWHCTRQPLEPGQYYAAAYPAPNAPPGGAGLIILKDLAQDEGGLDLAIARVSPPIAPRLLLTEQPAAIGEDVYTLGFPLVPPPVRVPNGNLIFDDVDRRFLRGYITKIGTIKLPSGYEIDAIEVDMLVPPGISGAPLLRSGTMEVIGVIVGNHSSYFH